MSGLLVQEKYLEIDGNKVRYLESGTCKNTIVLIHGLGASAERWLGVIPHFEKEYRVIVPDLIGFGLSDKPLVDYTPEFFVDFLEKMLTTLNISKPLMIGSSLGGQITAEFAVAKKGSLKKLVLVSPAGVMKQSTPALDAYIMAALYPNEESAKIAFEMMEASGKQIDPLIVKSFVDRMQKPNAKMAFMSTILGLKNAEIITKRLPQIDVPTMIIWGGNDPVIPIVHAEQFVSSIKDCRFYRMDECGHTPYVQKPSEFSKKVLEFFES